MDLYSYKGDEPKELPVRITIPAEESPSGSRETRTKLHTLSEEELRGYGFYRVDLPTYDKLEYDCEWNSSEIRYDLIAISDEEKARRAALPEEEKVADWVDFNDRLPLLEIYKKLYASEIPFLMQFIMDTRIMFIHAQYGDERAFRAGEFNLQQGIDILSVIAEGGVTQEDRDNFLTNLVMNDLDAEIQIPTSEWREHHYFELNDSHLSWHAEKWGHYTHCLKDDGANVGG